MRYSVFYVHKGVMDTFLEERMNDLFSVLILNDAISDTLALPNLFQKVSELVCLDTDTATW